MENNWRDIAIQAAQWGADQELEACCEWLAYEGHEHEHLALYAARRPKPPSLDDVALVFRARALLAQPEPEGPTDEELLRVAATAIDPYESSGIALGEYEPETECAVEAYGSELIAYARAALAKWGHQ
jgi:hypothetical protein